MRSSTIVFALLAVMIPVSLPVYAETITWIVTGHVDYISDYPSRLGMVIARMLCKTNGFRLHGHYEEGPPDAVLIQMFPLILLDRSAHA